MKKSSCTVFAFLFTISICFSQNTANEKKLPEAPFPYLIEEVTFENKNAGIMLSGTFTIPKKSGTYPAVILVSGSGPQNRDEEILGHKPFLVLADYLTRNGIAVLRYDDRGTAKSTGDFATATSSDFAEDAKAAVNFLKARAEVNKLKIGIIGHSEGGLIAPMVAANNTDVSYIVLLAGPGIPGDEILLKQQELIGAVSGANPSISKVNTEVNSGAYIILKENKNDESLHAALTSYFNGVTKKYPGMALVQGYTASKYVDKMVEMHTNPWFYQFINYDPKPMLQKVSCPVLAINGDKDLQVPSTENLEAIEFSLKKGGNTAVTIVELPNMNHLFQETKTGSIAEYGTINYSFSPVMLRIVNDWILAQTN